jgi:hypothetical protein
LEIGNQRRKLPVKITTRKLTVSFWVAVHLLGENRSCIARTSILIQFPIIIQKIAEKCYDNGRRNEDAN